MTLPPAPEAFFRRSANRCRLAILVVALLAVRTDAQTGASGETPSDPVAAAIASAARAAQRTDEPATLVYANRPIVAFRATILSRTPAARAAAASEALDSLVAQVPGGEVTTHAYDGGTLVSLGGRPVFAVLAADVDPLAGELLDTKVREAASRLTVAVRESGELRSPRQLLRSVAIAIGATIVYVLLLWILIRLDTRAAGAAGRAMERRLRALPAGEVMVVARAPLLVQRLLTIVGVALALLLTYSWLTFILRRFPYTRPWGRRSGPASSRP